MVAVLYKMKRGVNIDIMHQESEFMADLIRLDPEGSAWQEELITMCSNFPALHWPRTNSQLLRLRWPAPNGRRGRNCRECDVTE